MSSKESLCNEQIFDSFFKRESTPLLQFLYYKFGDKAAAEDVVQESFSRIWERCNEVPVDTARGFLYTTAKNLSVSIKRHEQVQLRFMNEAIKIQKQGSEQDSPDYIIIGQEFQAKLKEAIAALPERQRIAYLLNRVEKKTYKEVAELMEVSVKAVEKLIHKALLKLKEKIDELGG